MTLLKESYLCHLLSLLLAAYQHSALHRLAVRLGAWCSRQIEESAILRPLCREGAARHLSGLGPVVYLNVPLEELTKRIRNLSTRGIAMEPGQTLADLYAERVPLYERYAHQVVDCQGIRIRDVVHRIASLV